MFPVSVSLSHLGKTLFLSHCSDMHVLGVCCALLVEFMKLFCIAYKPEREVGELLPTHPKHSYKK